MINYKAENLGKKYFHNWVFKGLEFELNSGDQLLIIGSNGSGKTSLLKILAGQMRSSTGNITLHSNDQPIGIDSFYKEVSWVGPYFELYHDLSVEETLTTHFSFKKNLLSSTQEILERIKLKKHKNKKLHHLSSGMLQRLMVSMVVISDSKIVLLDEPTANLDSENKDLIMNLIFELQGDRILIFVSNDTNDFDFFENRLNLNSFSS